MWASVGTVRFMSAAPDVLEVLAMHVQVVAIMQQDEEEVQTTLARVEGGKLIR